MISSLAYKIIKKHLAEPVEMKAGNTIRLKIDNTLTQDATGTMAFLQFEKMGIDQVKCKAVSYVDHNTMQTGFMNADDHKYLQTVANRYGVLFSKAGNGICHQVQLERFDKPGETLLGSDSHTPTGGGMGMIAIGAGGLDVACAMAGIPYTLQLPQVVNVHLTGSLRSGVSAKDIILKVLSIKSVKGGVGKIFEYSGEGIKTLSVPERSTITNMGAELGATTSLFPSDENTKEFLEKQGRGEDYIPLQPDENAEYDEVIEINLSELEPLIAAPHSPDNVQKVSEVAGQKVDQVCIGSCTNSSFTDLCNVANILKGKKVHPDVSLTISFGSKQVLNMLAQNGALTDIISSGARLLEAACGPCIGMGQSPKSDGVSLRTFNRNFYGRSGTMSANVYLVSPETAAISAINGYISDASDIDYEKVSLPDEYYIDDSGIIQPDMDPEKPIIKGPNIKDVPIGKPLSAIDKKVMIKVEDNITTDHIIPGGSNVLPFRSNIEKISDFTFSQIDPDFSLRCTQNAGGIIIAGENYGQGSSREHAALAPLYLGIRAVIAKSYARIHKQNLINSAIIPLLFINNDAYEKIDLLDELEILDIENLAINQTYKVYNKTKDFTFEVKHDLSEEQIQIIKNGGLLNTIKLSQKE
ncbi:MAG: aconitate hydratase [Clostridiaceae bacterium]|nr:aconitate hydratase [Clostridiaceae bacterium]